MPDLRNDQSLAQLGELSAWLHSRGVTHVVMEAHGELLEIGLACSGGSVRRAQFLRLRARRGTKKAIVAVAASLLTAVYYMVRDETRYKDLGIGYFEKHDRSRIARRFVARLQQLGFNVHLTEAAA